MTRRVFRWSLGVYLWSFILYQLTPVELLPYTNYAPTTLSPKPMLYAYAFAYDVKTAFSNHAGSIKNLITSMDKSGFEFVLGDFPHTINDKLFPAPPTDGCLRIKLSDTGFGKKVLHFLFEALPKVLVGVPPDSVLSREKIGGVSSCVLLSHDESILLSSSLGLDLPPYRWVLGAGKNLYLSRDVLIKGSLPDDVLEKVTVLLGRERVSVFAYSSRSFYLPGERTVYVFRFVVETDLKNPLIYLYRDGELAGVFNQRRLNLKVKEKGFYSAKIASYKFRLNVIYFGVRTVAVSSAIGFI